MTDNLGATDVATVLLEIEEPPFVDHRATGELAGSGTVSGSYQATHDDDGAEQWVRERESGGKKSRRYSYLRHTWLFEIPPGSVSTLFLDARQSASSDGDQMVFSYSIDGSSYTPVINLSAGSTPYNAALPDSVTGDVRIRVEDSDSTLGHVSLDTVYVDHMFLRTENSSGGAVPENAVLNSVIAVSSSGIDLSWIDNSDDEYGFSVERSSADTGPWATAGSAAADQALYSDTGLSHSTRYYYRVVAYNGAGDAQASNVLSAITDIASAVTLSTSGYKAKGVQHVTLTWASLDSANVFRDGVSVASGVFSGYDDNIDRKGGGSYVYQVCSGDLMPTCSNEEVVVF